MAKSSNLSIAWDKGLVTAITPSSLAPGALQSMRNCVNAGGAMRLDARYGLYAGTTTQIAQGIGYGRYENTRMYAVIAGGKLYRVVAGSYSEITALGTMAAGDWWVTQFEDKLYFANETGGMAYMNVLGTGTGTISVPAAPASAPSVRRDLTSVQSDFTGSSCTGAAINGTSTITTTYDSAFPGWKITSTAAATVTGTITFDTSPDLRPTFTYNDVAVFPMRGLGAFNWTTLKTSTWDSEATDSVRYSYAFSSVQIPDGRDGGRGTLILQAWPGIPRAKRTTVKTINYIVTFGEGGGSVIIGPPRYEGVWMSLANNRQYSPPLPFERLQYATTCYNSTTGFESALSPIATVEAGAQNEIGDWFTITGATSAEAGVDYIRFYRGITTDGATTWYRLASVANSGTPAHTDKLTTTEVSALDTYTPSAPPNDGGASSGSATGASAITTWQNRLVVATGSICWISREGRPLEFESLTGDTVDALDEARGLTFYPDDRRSEKILALIGQQSLYIVTDLSVRAVIGSTPSNWRLVKLPGQEGACGPRAACPFMGGILVLTPSGRLLVFSENAEPVNIGAALLPRIDHDGLKAYATTNAVVQVNPKGEIHIRSGSEYLILAEGAWRGGSYNAETHALAYVSGEPDRFLGTDGLLYEMGNNLTDDAGTPVYWSFTTREYAFDPAHTAVSVMFDAQEGTDTDGSVIYPTVVAFSDRETTGPVTKEAGKRHTIIKPLVTGENLTFTFEGDKDTVIYATDIQVASSGPGQQL